ncbi:MAG: glycosyltransferase family 9 protein [Pseudomonadales bacterium]|nr:glycosyltransferase family 9 protein [Pseudomonadales bacterium]
MDDIAVMRFSALGDLAMTIPAIQSLKQKPLMVTSALGRQLLADVVDDFLILDNKKLPQVMKLIGDIRKSDAKVLLDFQISDRSKVIRVMSGKKVIHPEKIDRCRTSRCATEIFLDTAVQQVGGNVYDYSPKCPEKNYIVLHPGSSEKWLSKRLPLNKWKEFSQVLWDRYQLPFMITGTKVEKDYCLTVQNSLVGKSENLVGKLSISDLKNLVDNAFLTLSTDSGPMHLSAVLKTPTIGLFGATNWKYFSPFGPWSVALHDEVFYKGQLPPLKNLMIAGGAYNGIRIETALQALEPFFSGAALSTVIA